MQHNLLIGAFFIILYLISPALVSAEIQTCINRGEGKITCTPVPSHGAETLKTLQSGLFTGRVTQILDHRTLEVISQGTTMRIRIRPVEDTSKEDLEALALHQNVIGNIRNIDADGTPIADVALRHGDNLRDALRQRQLQKPEVRARYERKREEEAHQREERIRQQAAEAERKKAQEVAEAKAARARALSQETTPSALAPTISPPVSLPHSAPIPRSAEPSTSQGCQSLECQLVSINVGRVVTESHQQVSQFRTLLDRIEGKVRNTRQEIADITAKSQQLLRNQGQRIGLLDLMHTLDTAIPESAASLGLNFAEVAAMVVTLTAPKR